LHVARVDSRRRVRDSGDLVAKIDRLQRFGGLRLTLTAAPISPKAGAASKTSAFIPKVVSACAAASPASPPPTIAILQLDDIRFSVRIALSVTGQDCRSDEERGIARSCFLHDATP
jgi:hypothetical protein